MPVMLCRTTSRGVPLTLILALLVIFFLGFHFTRRENVLLVSPYSPSAASSFSSNSELGGTIRSQRLQRLLLNDDAMTNYPSSSSRITSTNTEKGTYHDKNRIRTDSIHSTGNNDYLKKEEEEDSEVKELNLEQQDSDKLLFEEDSNPLLRPHRTDSTEYTNFITNSDNRPNSLETASRPDTSPHYRREQNSGVQVSHCSSRPNSWDRGVITELKPRIKANCDLLKHNNRPEVERVKHEIKSWNSLQSEEDWRESLSNCSRVVEDFSNNFYNSRSEVEFPLAYILVVYTNPQQMVRLIKALWRPQNIFCIHPDAKQSQEYIGVFRQLARCLDNVFLPRKLEKVYYQHHTIMDSQMNCYEDLMTYPPSRWKYAINLCGRELPLKTNREMVDYLIKLKGHSAIETQHVNTDSKGYVSLDRFRWKAKEDYSVGKLHYTTEHLKKPPIPIYKSTNFIAATRSFVNFFLTDQKAIAFRNYLKDVKIPEEEFYASLIHLPRVPGGLPPRGIALPTIDRYIWMNKHRQTRSKWESCEGRTVHFICIVGAGDLDQVYRLGVDRRSPVFFFNKYFMEEDHVVMDCMEERLIRQNMKEHEHDCSHKHS